MPLFSRPQEEEAEAEALIKHTKKQNTLQCAKLFKVVDQYFQFLNLNAKLDPYIYPNMYIQEVVVLYRGG